MASIDLSKAEQNFIYFAKVCIDLIKLPLIDILTEYVKPGDLYVKIKCSSTLMYGKNKLRPDQLKLCFFPLPLLPDYSKFDATLLYTLIRNLCPSLTPTRGWGNEPMNTDTEIGDDIERLRLFRNSYAHGKFTEISDNEFRTLWSYIKDVSERIQTFTVKWSQYNYKEEFQKIECKKFGYDDRERYKLLLEATIYISKQTEFRDEPAILIKGAEEVSCGETALSDAEVKQTEISKTSTRTEDVYRRDISKRKEDDKGFVETNSSIAILGKMGHRAESSGGTSLETKLDHINFFCESKGFSVQIIILDIKEKLYELPLKALETIDLLWRSRSILESKKTAYIIVQGIQILGTGLALVGKVFSVVGICSKVVQLVVSFLKIIFKISEPNIKLMLDPKVNTNDIYVFAGLAERLKSLNSILNAADDNKNADESSIQGIISNVDIHIGVDEIGNLKNRIEEMMREGEDHLMTCLHFLTIFVRICTLRHSILFSYINYLTRKEYYQSVVHRLQGFIENERVDHQNFLSFFPLPTLDNASVVAAFDPSEHTELAAFLTEMRLPLQDLRNALHDRVFLIQPVVNSSVLLGRPNAFISDSVKFMTLSLASDNIHIKFKFTAIEHSFNLFYIQSPLSGKYMYMKENLYCKHGVMTNPPLYAQWNVVQIQKPDNEDDAISHFLLSTKQWPNRFICLVGRDAKGLDDESSPNINCLFKLIPLGGSPIPVQKPVQGNPEKAQENPLKTTMRQSVVQRRVVALWTITGFLKERQIRIENDITEIENYVLDESNEEYNFLNSTLESIATVIEVLHGNEFNENMMDGMQRVLLICFELFKDDFPFGSILRQLLRMCGAIISCIWQTHGIADFICRHLKQEDEHRSEIQNDIHALQRFAVFLHEIERCENILERHISHMINESKICDELGCLANLKETSLTKNHPHLMVTSLKVGVIQLAVTWQKYAVAKYPGHSDLEAKQLRQIIQLQMQNENLFMNKCREKALSTSSLRTVVNMPLFTSGWDMDVTEVYNRQVRRKN